MTATTDDPIRAEVERVLHALVELTFAVPFRLATAVPRCVLRRAQGIAPLAEPWRVARSLFELVAAGGPGTTATPAPTDSAVAPTVTPAELEEVRAFESAHRGRRTVLGRIEQLLA